nr:O-antigen ligase family protein [Roseospira navarrensis]
MLSAAFSGYNTVFCPIPEGIFAGFHTHYRIYGLSGDPNIFSIQLAVLALLSSALLLGFGAGRGFQSGLVALLALVPLAVLLTGSRTGLVLLLPVAVAWMLTGWGRWAVLALGVITATGFAANHLVWSELPCPGQGRGSEVVSFSERNDPLSYFGRYMTADEAAAKAQETVQQQREMQEETLRRFRAMTVDDDIIAAVSNVADADIAGLPLDSLGMPGMVAHQFILLTNDLPLDQARVRLWQAASLLWAIKPVMGNGPGRMTAFTADANRSHNWYLTTAAETGLVGLVAFLLPISAALGAGVYAFVIGTVDRRIVLVVVTAAVVAAAAPMAQDVGRQGVLWAAWGLALALVPVARTARAPDPAAAATPTA